jgi:hypothetical protein
MPEANTEFERFLTERANRSLGQLCNFIDRGSGLGMSTKLFHIGFGIFTANGFPFSFLGQLSLLDLLKRPSNTRDLLGNQSRHSAGLSISPRAPTPGSSVQRTLRAILLFPSRRAVRYIEPEPRKKQNSQGGNRPARRGNPAHDGCWRNSAAVDLKFNPAKTQMKGKGYAYGSPATYRVRFGP